MGAQIVDVGEAAIDTGYVTVVLVDENQMSLERLRAMLTSSAGFEVIAEAGCLAEAMAAIGELKPQLIVIDPFLSDGGGREIIEWLKRAPEPPFVLVCTTRQDDRSLCDALGGGADGYVLKAADGTEVIRAARVVVMGGMPIDPTVAPQLVHALNSNDHRCPAKASPDPGLTRREMEVLAAMRDGCTNAEIGVLLGISAGTVKTHSSNLFRKLGVKGRAQAISASYECGILPLQ